MARLESQQRMGYYPLPPVIIDHICQWIKPTDGMTLCDPCAGEGRAVKALAEKLGVPQSRIVACELDGERSRKLAENLPEAYITQQVDFQAATYAPRSISLMYLNPPYDGELGASGRTEGTFLSRATNILIPGGILVFVAPRKNVRMGILRTQLHNMYYRIESLDFPDNLRNFGECVVIAYKRRKPTSDQSSPWNLLQKTYMATLFEARRGTTFQFRKTEYTDQELISVIDVQRSVETITGNRRQTSGRVRPPLQLGDGHKALLLAAGYLNGRIAKPGREPHVVRGTCRKQEVVKDETTDKKSKTVVTEERIELLIRKVNQSGNIQEICDGASAANNA